MAASPGDSVTILVPLVDRDCGDLINILGVVHNRDEKELYTLATRTGVLKCKYSRNQFD